VRKSLKAMAVTAFSAVALFTGANSAFAGGYNYAYTPDAWAPDGSHECVARIELTGSSYDYATAEFTNTGYGHCDFYVERAYITNGVQGPWQGVGSYANGPYTITGAGDHWTGSFYDGPDVRMRVIMYVSWNYTMYPSAGI
jgi:hypothetical protein